MVVGFGKGALVSWICRGFFCLRQEHTTKTEKMVWVGVRCVMILNDTPRKINIEPENVGLEDDFPFPVVYFQVSC